MSIKTNQQALFSMVDPHDGNWVGSSTIEGITYLIPNDESEYIVAIDPVDKLAKVTTFYEMEDFFLDDYRIVNHNGVLTHNWEAFEV